MQGIEFPLQRLFIRNGMDSCRSLNEAILMFVILFLICKTRRENIPEQIQSFPIKFLIKLCTSYLLVLQPALLACQYENKRSVPQLL
jgi:hypothetical protein